MALVLGALGGWLGHPRAPAATSIRFYINGDSTRKISGSLALAPDGSRVVYVAETPAGRMLFEQRLSELEPRAIPGTNGVGDEIFFSPDGAWIAFESDQNLKMVRPDGSGLTTLATYGGILTGGSWAPDGTIVYGTYPDGHIFRVSAEGGPPQRIELGGVDTISVVLSEPRFLPGGRTILWTNILNGQLEALSLANNRLKSFGSGYSPRFLPPGYLLFAQDDGSLVLQAFHTGKLELTGTPSRLVERVVMLVGLVARYDVTATGTLAYVPLEPGAATLTLTQRDGQRKRLASGPRFWVPRFSPDGRRVAYGGFTTGALGDVWIYDLRLETAQRLTSGGDTGLDYNDPVWSPDGKRVALSALNGNAKDLYIVAADGTGQPAELLKRPGEQWTTDWSPDGHFILFTDTPPNGKQGIWMVPAGGGEPRQLVSTAYNAAGGRISPDSHWLAYQSDETGRMEIYIQPFPGPGAKVRISSDGGFMPVWSRSGAEIFYLSRGRLIAVHLRRGVEIEVERREPLFEVNLQTGGSLAQFDVHPDGLRFVAAEESRGSNRIAVITNVLADSGR